MVRRIHANFPGQDYTHLWSTLGSFHRQSDGHPLDGHRAGARLGDFVRLLDNGFPGCAARALGQRSAIAPRWRPIIGAAFKMCVPFIVILPGLLGLAVLPEKLVGEAQAVAAGVHSYNEVLPLMLARYCGPGLLGLGYHCADRRLHVGHGRQRQRVRDGLDLRHLPRVHSQDMHPTRTMWRWAAGAPCSAC